MARKLKRTISEVEDAARQWYARQWAEHEAKHGQSENSYRIYGASPDIYGRRCWAVQVEITTKDGHPVDSGPILLVNDETLQVEAIEGL